MSALAICHGQAVIGVPGVVSSQYHAQDELGQYSYGYAGGPSAKQETRTADGITRGGYSYLDANGIVQSAAYVSDPVNGFRVAATNLPVGPSAPIAVAPAVVAAAPAAVAAAPVAIAGPSVVAASPVPVADTLEVVAARAAHLQAHQVALLGRKKRQIYTTAAWPSAVSGYSTLTTHGLVGSHVVAATPVVNTHSVLLGRKKRQILTTAAWPSAISGYNGYTTGYTGYTGYAATPLVNTHSVLLGRKKRDLLAVSPALGYTGYTTGYTGYTGYAATHPLLTPHSAVVLGRKKRDLYATTYASPYVTSSLGYASPLGYTTAHLGQTLYL